MTITKEIATIFETIAPYNQQQIDAALQWLTTNTKFKNGVRYIYPDWSDEEIVYKLNKCNNCADFQVNFIEPMIRSLIENSIHNLHITGLEDVAKAGNNLYISNHRDIFLDSGLLQYTLYHRGYPFTEISLGDNLIVNSVMERVAKLNNMYTVFRSGTRVELLQNAKNLSAYLRYSISHKKVSSWIAQGNGRTKDGNDKTFPGLVRMLLMSGGSNLKQSLKDLHIVISSVSYEYEPCAVEKAVELQTKDELGRYKKAKFENINSIIRGVEEPKGDVSLHFEKLNVEKIDFSGDLKSTVRAIADEMDRLVYKNYKLFKTNYMAYDMLHKTNLFVDFYTRENLNEFKEYMQSQSNDLDIQERLLKMYANPVINKQRNVN
ncbi:1-acyl-sn-glycerol-3-phosphate acyltransferase [Aureibaculum sp. A20]|uniref:1-acyl-sn-glycerol-3-phosphate acyltransferase n=1 Tax=Aureibaculum flavum TaxID=2795986 RepID=A0ABS0WM49_9FLAO|nr:1-acyl-sn-glycerol-3-phosphate acyltransferase [Aureibaculum flavum]MBJ2173045.1 1-acyl-sn-glycerol-3-phosphate acyltransferase [Aureibaculum flavum]